MKKIALLTFALTMSSVAVAGPGTDHIISLWRNAQTNEYRAIMERRLGTNQMDVVGWLMRYQWDWIICDRDAAGLVTLTNTMGGLRRAVEAYRGPVFAMRRGFFIPALNCDEYGLLHDDRTEQQKRMFEAARRSWEASEGIYLHKSDFQALEQDGMFEEPPRVWTEDPTLYRVAEAETNLYECVTNLWFGGAVTNVSLIAQRRLATNPNDPMGLLLATDCAYAVMDIAAYSNVSARLVATIGAMTNLTASAETAHELPGEVHWNLRSMQELERDWSDHPIARIYPKYAFGIIYPHADLLEELWQLRR